MQGVTFDFAAEYLFVYCIWFNFSLRVLPQEVDTEEIIQPNVLDKKIRTSVHQAMGSFRDRPGSLCSIHTQATQARLECLVLSKHAVSLSTGQGQPINELIVKLVSVVFSHGTRP